MSAEHTDFVLEKLLQRKYRRKRPYSLYAAIVVGIFNFHVGKYGGPRTATDEPWHFEGRRDT